MSFPETLPNSSVTAGAQQAPATNRKAKTSFKLGLLSFIFTILTGVPAVIWGFLSLREIGRSGNLAQGKRLALAGIVLGLVGSLSSGSFLLYAVAKVQRAAQVTSMA
jgi:hypothetical protein